MGLLVSKEDGDKGFYAESFKVNNNWMNRNIQFMKNTKLRDMSIIGSHDSGTYAITEDTTARGMARTQNCSLKEQCGYGIRYFDLRVGGDGKDPNKLAIYHGPIYCLGWKEGMQQIVDFIAENPKEVLILKFKKETAMSKAQQEYFLDFTMN